MESVLKHEIKDLPKYPVLTFRRRECQATEYYSNDFRFWIPSIKNFYQFSLKELLIKKQAKDKNGTLELLSKQPLVKNLSPSDIELFF